jgi:Tol biopolymer transport system component
VTWSKDGTKLAYQALSGKWTQVWRMAANGTGKVNLSKSRTNDTEPALLPDGRVVFVRNGQIWRMNADGTGTVKLTTPPSGLTDNRPTVSPDGTKIAFDRWGYQIPGGPPEGGGQVFVMNVNGSNVLNLSRTVGVTSDYAADWSPNGLRIVFIRADMKVCDQLYRMDANGANVTRISEVNATSPAYAPDGTKVVFTAGGSALSISTIPIGGGTPTIVAAGTAPAWQPTP